MVDILVVEDDRGIRALLHDLLASEGYDVRLAADGVEALDACSQALPDLMIFDLSMPRMDGHELLAEVGARGWRGQFPLFAVTARSGACTLLIEGAQVDECVQKPFDVFDLLERVERLLLPES